VDDTTNRINRLLYKVNCESNISCLKYKYSSSINILNCCSFFFQIRSIRMCGSLALNMCGVACGRLDLCYEIGFGGPWYGLKKLIAVVFFKKNNCMCSSLHLKLLIFLQGCCCWCCNSSGSRWPCF
jgi:hypothetical protein